MSRITKKFADQMLDDLMRIKTREELDTLRETYNITEEERLELITHFKKSTSKIRQLYDHLGKLEE